MEMSGQTRAGALMRSKGHVRPLGLARQVPSKEGTGNQLRFSGRRAVALTTESCPDPSWKSFCFLTFSLVNGLYKHREACPPSP